MKKVLLVGNGAREHVIGETLRNSGAQVFCYGKARNPGLLQVTEDYESGSLEDFAHLRDYARKVKADFAFIGPEDPIGNGAADALLEIEIHSVAPLKTVARLESSKSFTRDLLKKYNIVGNPKFQVFYDDKGMEEFLSELGEDFVVKADGLMGGKGVKVAGDHLKNHNEALAYARECLQQAGRVIIEEKFVGQEFSLMSFVDGKNTVEMPAVQDHKRAFEGDHGPNTGGMGSYSDANHLLPFLQPSDIEKAAEITREVALALFKETGAMFKGIMYGGFIATAKGVRLIEYNARFGDPEVLNVLPLLNTNFVHICESIISGDLSSLKVEFERKATVCKYLVPEGYPDHPQKGKKITIGKVPNTQEAKRTQSANFVPMNNHQKVTHYHAKRDQSAATQQNSFTVKQNTMEVKMYYAAVDQTPEGLMLSSSRAVAFVGIANAIAEAEKLAENACKSVKGPVFHRKDIGTAELLQKRIEMMERLRKNQ